jgi:pyruvate/2-oxoglutarate dehydrogenase complex dihydrolipoamide dehydrogenase (E3) component
MDEQVEVVVLGLGPGGEYVAGTLAERGLDVVGIDRLLVGGECPYWGCIPSKMMIRAGNALAEARRVDALAGYATVTPDWAKVANRIRDEATDDWDDAVAVERFERKGGRFVRGEGRLIDANSVQVDDTVYRASRAIVVASGTRAFIPPIPGLDGTPFWTNREIIETKELPESLIALGGGAISAELSQVFARFGTRVTIVEGRPRLIGLEEPEASYLVRTVFEREGIDVRTAVTVENVAYADEQFTVTLSEGDPVTAERLLVATGRVVDLASIGAGALGIDEEGRSLPVDGHMRVCPGVWAVGDVTGKGAFTHVAMYQGRIAVADILGDPHVPADYRALPRVTFTDPEVGSVGLTHAAAIEQGIMARDAYGELSASSRGFIHGPGNEGFIKLVEDGDRGVLVGATTAGPAGGEMLGLLTLAIHEQIPVDRLRTMIWPYPTFHRAIESALDDLGVVHDT